MAACRFAECRAVLATIQVAPAGGSCHVFVSQRKQVTSQLGIYGEGTLWSALGAIAPADAHC
jgi:hypothetical protein